MYKGNLIKKMIFCFFAVGEDKKSDYNHVKLCLIINAKGCPMVEVRKWVTMMMRSVDYKISRR